MNKYTYRLFSLMSLLMVGLLHAQDTAETAAPAGDQNLFDLILAGGWAMIPLGLTCCFMLYLCFYCFMETQRGKFIPDAVLPKLQNEMQVRDVQTANTTLGASPSVLSRALSVAMLKARPDWEDCNKSAVETSFIEVLESEDTAIGAWINYLNVCAAVAPMIGLLGTVSGMIGAFQTIGTVGMGDPSKLAGDIGSALITTAAGLVIGIPAMIFYFIFKNRLSAKMVATAQSGSLLIDYMAGEIGAEEYSEEYAE